MNLNIRSLTAVSNNEILVCDGTFSLGRNGMVNASVPEKSSHKTSIVSKHTNMLVDPKEVHTSAIMHGEERLTWYSF